MKRGFGIQSKLNSAFHLPEPSRIEESQVEWQEYASSQGPKGPNAAFMVAKDSKGAEKIWKDAVQAAGMMENATEK